MTGSAGMEAGEGRGGRRAGRAGGTWTGEGHNQGGVTAIDECSKDVLKLLNNIYRMLF